MSTAESEARSLVKDNFRRLNYGSSIHVYNLGTHRMIHIKKNFGRQLSRGPQGNRGQRKGTAISGEHRIVAM